MAKAKSYKDLLTQRELEIAGLMKAGRNSREIAEKLYISFYTVKAHRRNIYRKLKCKSLMKFLYLLNNHDQKKAK